jgi:hypothetical protein
MSRWQSLIEDLLRELEQLIPGGGFRDDIDDLLRDVEELVRDHAEPLRALETPIQRQHEFEVELRRVLAEHLEREPSNPVWREALNLLDHPQLRPSRR